MSAKRTSDAVSILHNRYVKDDPAKKAVLEQERVNVYVARLIRDMREQAGLSQAELAAAIDTGQSAISRLEDADYDGHSLRILQRIADALEHKLVVQMTTEDSAGPGRIHFPQFLQQLRRLHGYTVDELARKTGIDRMELVLMERGNNAPQPVLLNDLSKVYKVPLQQLLQVAGLVHDQDDRFEEQASKFAAHSESFDKLTRDEKKALDEFLAFLRMNT